MQAYRKGAHPAPVPHSIHLDNLESNFDSNSNSNSSSHIEHVESRLSFKYHNVFHAFYQIVKEEGNKCCYNKNKTFNLIILIPRYS